MLSKRALKLKPSPTLALAAKAKELQAEGKDVISLSVGEPDWDTVTVAKTAAIDAIEKGFTKYTPAAGIPELRKAIMVQTEKETGIAYKVDDVVVSTGGKFVIFAAIQAVVNPGDEVIIPAPYWVSYPVMVELADGISKVVVTKQEKSFKLTADELRAAITPKTKLLILNSPSNPTGNMYSRDELTLLAEVLRKNPQVLILSDDIYNRLVFDVEIAPHILQVAPDLRDRVLVMNGASKTYSMTGWRMGWALGPSAWIRAIANYASQSVSQAMSITQKATIAALEKGDPEIKASLKELKRRRDLAVESFRSIRGLKLGIPDGAFYIWPDIKACLGKTYSPDTGSNGAKSSWAGKKIATSTDFSQSLLEAEHVAVVPGIEFGLEGYLRISYALKDARMNEACERVRRFVGSLK